MTVDATGRAHKPAGSPSSTGGQFAAAATPAAASQLDSRSTDRDIDRHNFIGLAAEQLHAKFPDAASIDVTVWDEERLDQVGAIRTPGQTETQSTRIPASAHELISAFAYEHDPGHLGQRLGGDIRYAMYRVDLTGLEPADDFRRLMGQPAPAPAEAADDNTAFVIDDEDGEIEVDYPEPGTWVAYRDGVELARDDAYNGDLDDHLSVEDAVRDQLR